MQNNITSQVETITPAIAKSLLENHNEGNRNLREQKVIFYAAQMLRGEWSLNGESIIIDNTGRVIDGQHRLAAIVKSGVTLQVVVVRGVSPDGFTTIDTGLNRTTADVFQMSNICDASYAASVVRKYYLMTTTNTTVISSSSSAWHGGRGGRNGISNARMVEIYNQHPTEFQEFCRYAHCLSKKQKLFSTCEIGAIIAYLHINKGHGKEKIYTFFDTLFQYRVHEGFEEMQAIKKLREKIQKNALANIKMSNRYKQNLLVKVWNAYIRGYDFKVFRADGDEVIDFI